MRKTKVACENNHVLWLPEDSVLFEWDEEPCVICWWHDAQAVANARFDELRHKGHGAWRRWTITRWVAGRMYALGIVSGTGVDLTAHCDGCVTFYWKGRRPYVLGLMREEWNCLWKGHRFASFDGNSFCGKCWPCPGCDSTTRDHKPGCEVGG